MALTEPLDGGPALIDNNQLERQIKPSAMGHKARMFVGLELAEQRAAVVTGLAQGHAGSEARTA